MPILVRRLGAVLTRIHDYDLGASIHLRPAEVYTAGTCCLVAWVEEGSISDREALDRWEALDRACLRHGYDAWLNVAVVSDTVGEVWPPTEGAVVAAFNEDCREGGWLWRMWFNGHPPH